MIATIAEKVNECRGDLRLDTSFASFVKFNMVAVNGRFLLEGAHDMRTTWLLCIVISNPDFDPYNTPSTE